MRIRAKYNLKGNILLLPLVGSGDVNMALKNVQTSVTTNISVRNKPEVSKVEDFQIYNLFNNFLLVGNNSNRRNESVFYCWWHEDPLDKSF